MLAPGSLIFHLSCEGKLRVTLESLQGQRDCNQQEVAPESTCFTGKRSEDHRSPEWRVSEDWAWGLRLAWAYVTRLWALSDRRGVGRALAEINFRVFSL